MTRSAFCASLVSIIPYLQRGILRKRRKIPPLSGWWIAASALFPVFGTPAAEKPAERIKLVMEDERVIVRGIRPEEQLWGAYQFPRPCRLGDRLVVSVHITNDSISTYGAQTRWFESRDAGMTWDPVYLTRSTDGGHTGSKPVPFADTGILPRLCKLDCGVTLLCYARPGKFVRASLNDSGTEWTEPLVVMTPGDRSALANKPAANPSFHDWDGTCNNPEMVPLDRNSVLFFYSDFYYPDESGVKRKTSAARSRWRDSDSLRAEFQREAVEPW